MGIFPKQNNEQFLFPPKLGEKLEVTITGELTRVKSDNAEFNYQVRGKGSTGYYDVLAVDGDKKMKINTWKLYFALKEVNPDIGDTIEISHPKSGEYIITKK
jgi:hypothetical protein